MGDTPTSGSQSLRTGAGKGDNQGEGGGREGCESEGQEEESEGDDRLERRCAPVGVMRLPEKSMLMAASDHTIVTSDSLGSVTFWDGASLAQKQTFRSHKADGMCMAIGPVSFPFFNAGRPD